MSQVVNVDITIRFQCVPPITNALSVRRTRTQQAAKRLLRPWGQYARTVKDDTMERGRVIEKKNEANSLVHNHAAFSDPPIDKLSDAWISMLARAHGLVELTRRRRRDPALQTAFGRSPCAQPSVVQPTLESGTAQKVSQRQHALDSIYPQHSQGAQHDHSAHWQMLEGI